MTFPQESRFQLLGTLSQTLPIAVSFAALAGSLMMRIGTIGSGGVAASRPDISLPYTPQR